MEQEESILALTLSERVLETVLMNSMLSLVLMPFQKTAYASTLDCGLILPQLKP